MQPSIEELWVTKIYLTHTRVDITYVLGYVSRFMEEPHEDHLVALKHILRYISGTINLGYYFLSKKEEQATQVSYNDSDLANDEDDQKSTIGVFFFFS